VEQSLRVNVGGPYFEDLERNQVFEAPALTLTSVHARACTTTAWWPDPPSSPRPDRVAPERCGPSPRQRC
jgi:hypothetical protein